MLQRRLLQDWPAPQFLFEVLLAEWVLCRSVLRADPAHGPPPCHHVVMTWQIDQYMYDNADALILVAAGNAGNFGARTVFSPALTKNGIAVGAFSSMSAPCECRDETEASSSTCLDPPVICTSATRRVLSVSGPHVTKALTAPAVPCQAPLGLALRSCCSCLAVDGGFIDPNISNVAWFSSQGPAFDGRCAVPSLTAAQPGHMRDHLLHQDQLSAYMMLRQPSIRLLTRLTAPACLHCCRSRRIKPDLLGPGQRLTSAAAGTPCGTLPLSGTSMATPSVSGLALLTRQYFMEGWWVIGSTMT